MARRPHSIGAPLLSCPTTSMPFGNPNTSSSVALVDRRGQLRQQFVVLIMAPVTHLMQAQANISGEGSM